MKKNIKKFASVAFVVLLTSCKLAKATTISYEEAKATMKAITDYQAENAKTLCEEGIYFRIDAQETENSKVSKGIQEVWYNENSNFLHYKKTVEQPGSSAKQEEYFGVIDGKYYRLNAITKEYTEFSSKESFENTFYSESTTQFNTYTQVNDSLSSMILKDTETSTYLYKSNGDGHLYINFNEKGIYEGTTIKSEGYVVIDNYLLNSLESKSVLTDGEGNMATITTKLTANYKVTANMPGLSGYTKQS